MQLTKQQTVLLAVLGLGAASLLVDRVFIRSGVTTPQAAEAQALSAPSGAAPSVQPAVSQTPQQFTTQSIAANLDRLHAQHQYDLAAVPDALIPPPSWQPPRADERSAPVPTATSARDLAAIFAKHHQLQAVMRSAGDVVALVDGKPYIVGASLDGFTLQRVTQRSAVFAFKDVSVELTLDPTPTTDR